MPFPRILLALLLLLLAALPACHVGRFFVYNFANITDHKIFPYTAIETGGDVRPFAVSERRGAALDTMRITVKGRRMTLTQYLDEATSTVSFVVVQRDSIVYERYFEGYEPGDLSTIFSVSKSITSLLTGIAVDEGHIADIDDPVTEYVPEFLDGDPRFRRLTIRHLLDMRSGLDYTESYKNPFSDMARLYYGRNQLKQLTRLGFDHEPGTHHAYQSGTTAILGIVVERATGTELGKYLEDKVWRPMGMEYPARWSLDDGRHRSTKSYSGLATTARDLAKIGQLYLNGGEWHGKRIVSAEWVRQSVTPDMDNDVYQFQWYGTTTNLEGADGETRYFDSEAAAEAVVRADSMAGARVLASQKYPGRYYVRTVGTAFAAHGILSQRIYADPELDLVIVRQGKKWDGGWDRLFAGIGEALE